MFVKICGEIELGVITEHVTKTNRGQYKSINHIKNMLKCLQAKEWCDVQYSRRGRSMVRVRA